MMFSPFRVPRHKSFNFQPRFYNPEKEELDARVKEAKIRYGKVSQDDVSKEERALRMKGQFERRNKTKDMRLSSRNSNIRMVVIFAILAIVSYFIFFV